MRPVGVKVLTGDGAGIAASLGGKLVTGVCGALAEFEGELIAGQAKQAWSLPAAKATTSVGSTPERTRSRSLVRHTQMGVCHASEIRSTAVLSRIAHNRLG